MPAGPNWPAQASTRDQNPSSYTSGLQSAEIWLAAPFHARAWSMSVTAAGSARTAPGLRWHPGRVISSHPRSITPAEPARLGTPARLTHTGAGDSGRHVDGDGFGAQLPGDRPGTGRSPLRRARMNSFDCAYG